MASIIHKRYIVHPYKFNMWIGIVSMVMIFAAFTSAFVVKKGDLPVWQHIQLPQIFTVSTIVIAISSACMHFAYSAFRKNNVNMFRGFMLLTFILGAAFLTLQIQGWMQLRDAGIFLDGNVSGSFIYVISGTHFIHVLGGVIALMAFAVLSFTKYRHGIITNDPEKDLNNKVGMEVMMTYWHFVDILWIYLYFFFIINK